MGEMTITLDDVASLLDILIIGAFYNCEHMDKEATIPVLFEELNIGMPLMRQRKQEVDKSI